MVEGRAETGASVQLDTDESILARLAVLELHGASQLALAGLRCGTGSLVTQPATVGGAPGHLDRRQLQHLMAGRAEAVAAPGYL